MTEYEQGPSSPETNEQIEKLIAKLEDDTEFMSGGFDALEDFQTLVQYSERALPSLFKDTESIAWWRAEAITTIAHQIGNPIEFPEEFTGIWKQISSHIHSWGIENGYVPESE